MKESRLLADDALCSFAKGEERGVQLLIGLKQFAPSDTLKAEIASQIEDETRHALLFSTRLADLDIDCEGLQKNLVPLYEYARECVSERDWVKCIAIQAVIEELAMAAFVKRYPQLDSKTQDVLRSVIADERRHLAFCLRQLSKVDTDKRAKVHEVHNVVARLIISVIDESQSKEEQKELISIMRVAYNSHKTNLKKIGIDILPLPLS